MKDAASSSILPTVVMLRTHSLTRVVQEEIERMILSGELPAGTRLNENAVAERLSVSRGPVREACRALAEQGLVYLVPNRGVFIKHLDKVEAMEIYDLRAGLTGLAAFLLAASATDKQIKQLETLMRELDDAADQSDFAGFHGLNLEFHNVIVEATGNGRLIKMNRALVKEFQLFRTRQTDRRESLMASNREHRAILNALQKRDGKKAYDVSFEHVANGKLRMLKALDSLTDEGPVKATPKSAKTSKRAASKKPAARTVKRASAK